MSVISLYLYSTQLGPRTQMKAQRGSLPGPFQQPAFQRSCSGSCSGRGPRLSKKGCCIPAAGAGRAGPGEALPDLSRRCSRWSAARAAAGDARLALEGISVRNHRKQQQTLLFLSPSHSSGILLLLPALFDFPAGPGHPRSLCPCSVPALPGS